MTRFFALAACVLAVVTSGCGGGAQHPQASMPQVNHQTIGILDSSETPGTNPEPNSSNSSTQNLVEPDIDALILTGTRCATAGPLNWAVSAQQVELEGTGIVIKAPTGWSVSRPRPALAVFSGPIGANTSGHRPIIEMFNAPRCSTYDTGPVHKRVALRSLRDGVGGAVAAKAYDDHGAWDGTLTSPRTSIVLHGVIKIAAVEIPLVLYYTEIATSPDFVIAFSASCSGTLRGSSTCQRVYQETIDSIGLP